MINETRQNPDRLVPRDYRVGMEIGGLPLHPLVVHTPVIMVPLTVLAVIVFAFLPRYRYLTRWPTAVLAVVSVLGVWAARITGTMLLEDRPELEPIIQTHQDRGDLLSLTILPFGALILLGVWTLGGPTGLVSGRGARDSRVAALEKVLPVVMVVAGLAILAQTILTGDAGARAVYER